jgi:hypothetical protein
MIHDWLLFSFNCNFAPSSAFLTIWKPTCDHRACRDWHSALHAASPPGSNDAHTSHPTNAVDIESRAMVGNCVLCIIFSGRLSCVYLSIPLFSRSLVLSYLSNSPIDLPDWCVVQNAKPNTATRVAVGEHSHRWLCPYQKKSEKIWKKSGR